METRTNSDVVMSSISAVVTRADGTVEDLGVVSYWHKNPIKRWLYNMKKRAGRVVHD